MKRRPDTPFVRKSQPKIALFPHPRAARGAQHKGEIGMCRNTVTEARKGFTLVELAVVIVIIGVAVYFFREPILAKMPAGLRGLLHL